MKLGADPKSKIRIGRFSLWMRRDVPGCAGMRLDAPGCAWMRRDAPGCAGMRLDAPGCAGMRRDASGFLNVPFLICYRRDRKGGHVTVPPPVDEFTHLDKKTLSREAPKLWLIENISGVIDDVACALAFSSPDCHPSLGLIIL